MSKDSHKTRKLQVYNQFPKYDINDDNTIISFIKEIFRVYPFNYSKMIHSDYLSDIREWIFNKTNNLPIDTEFKTRTYMAINNIESFPRCKVCGREFHTIKTFSDGFQTYCNSKCAMKDNAVKDKICQTNLSTYGVEHPTQLPEIKQKVVNTLQDRYGVSNPMEIEGAVEKIKQTKSDRYGDPNYNNGEKNKQTCMDRYGVEYSTQTEVMKEHSRKTCMDRYGVPNAGWTEESQKKIKKSNIDRFGVEFPSQNKDVKEKTRQTFNDRYGVDTPFQMDSVIEMNVVRTKTDSYNNYILNNVFDSPCFTLEEYLKRTDDTVEFPFKCSKCGNVFYSKHANGMHRKCPTCYPSTAGTSIGENEIFYYITEELGIEAHRHDRKVISPYEVDIYIPSKKIGIEYDGMYWHSVLEKDCSYHKTKNDIADKNGIELYHIYECYWNNRKKSVFSFLRRLLIDSDDRKFDFIIKTMKTDDARIFVENNSLYQFISSINLALELNGDTIAMIGCSKSCSSNKKMCDYVINYFCFKNDVYVSGVVEKLFSHFVNIYTPKRIYSYVDRRYDNGKTLEKIGFKFVEHRNPNVWYFKPGNNSLHSRHEFRKENMEHSLKIYDSKKTDIENMIQNGWNAIYDSGYKLYVMEIP